MELQNIASINGFEVKQVDGVYRAIVKCECNYGTKGVDHAIDMTDKLTETDKKNLKTIMNKLFDTVLLTETAIEQGC